MLSALNAQCSSSFAVAEFVSGTRLITSCSYETHEGKQVSMVPARASKVDS